MPVVPALGRGSGVQASPDYKKACLKKKKKKRVVNTSGEASSDMVPRKAILRPEGRSLEQELKEAPGNSFQTPDG